MKTSHKPSCLGLIGWEISRCVHWPVSSIQNASRAGPTPQQYIGVYWSREPKPELFTDWRGGSVRGGKLRIVYSSFISTSSKTSCDGCTLARPIWLIIQPVRYNSCPQEVGVIFFTEYSPVKVLWGKLCYFSTVHQRMNGCIKTVPVLVIACKYQSGYNPRPCHHQAVYYRDKEKKAEARSETNVQMHHVDWSQGGAMVAATNEHPAFGHFFRLTYLHF